MAPQKAFKGAPASGLTAAPDSGPAPASPQTTANAERLAKLAMGKHGANAIRVPDSPAASAGPDKKVVDKNEDKKGKAEKKDKDGKGGKEKSNKKEKEARKDKKGDKETKKSKKEKKQKKRRAEDAADTESESSEVHYTSWVCICGYIKVFSVGGGEVNLLFREMFVCCLACRSIAPHIPFELSPPSHPRIFCTGCFNRRYTPLSPPSPALERRRPRPPSSRIPPPRFDPLA